MPDALQSQATYPHRLESWRAGVQKRVDVACKQENGIVKARVRGWTARSASAQLISPDGKQRIPLPLTAAGSKSHLWISPKEFRLPQKSQSGIWKLEATFQDPSLSEERRSTTQEAVATFTHRSALWWDSNVERIFRDDEARYGRDRGVEVFAARHERESFQVAIDTSENLRDVTISVTDAMHENAKFLQSRIPAERFTVERIREVYLSSPPRGRAGWYPDALLPWRKCDISAGQRKLAWITISAPKDAEAGIYRGMVVANCAGKTLELPLKLTVFDFELPDRSSVNVVMGADVHIGRQGRDRTKWLRGD